MLVCGKPATLYQGTCISLVIEEVYAMFENYGLSDNHLFPSTNIQEPGRNGMTFQRILILAKKNAIEPSTSSKILYIVKFLH